MGLKELWSIPYRWFTLAFIGATALNYTLSVTAWPYLGNKESISLFGQPTSPLKIVIGITFIELIAGYLSKWFSKRIDRIKQPKLRMPAASLMWLVPVFPLYFIFFQSAQANNFLYVLIVATFLFRMATASIFGTLNSVGQLLIESDERRATLLSMSSALASFFMAAAFIVVGNSFKFQQSDFGQGIQIFWMFITLPCVLMLAVGGYLVARTVRN
jgi:hypothetical protein